MLIELIIIGLFIGIISGILGIGGGIILIPILIIFGINIREAINISIIQMMFSSIFGSYLNYKNKSIIFRDTIYIGMGGFFGGFIGNYLSYYLSERTLYIMFLFIILYSIYKLSFSKKNITDEKYIENFNIAILIMLGIPIGIFSITLGIGGSILLVPILITLLHYPIKRAVSSGLFFVVFSSIGGVISYFIKGDINLEKSLPLAIASLFGVALGIKIKDYIKVKYYKIILILLYIFILIKSFSFIM